ncbi:uncharacterized protein AC631_01921 [Debaryomyces fabryi]|uniref:Cell division control protein 25 n=1 Tax=Debaryomyces fabryi TaxID=58627 RepID=A0A0V1Q1I2_9ASCO|nr:uncharacterized protein AC631_01921 [Debaryomyces fabryi]KSA02363.1 hypothetical protein AC631_01921 [Debaryomyces fabryi]CUM51586.1 unnamed protein product [Debaryomyces fabryi]
MSKYLEEIAPDAIVPHDTKEELDQPLKHLDTVIALYDFPGTQPSHLPLSLGDTIYVLTKSDSGWWDGVIIYANGEMGRGWFPNNYVRLINYVQPVLNKLKSHKEIDSLTAANTAANVLIPSFTNLLQKNLGESERNSPANSTRKNSVVSFASSETSIPSEHKGQTASILGTSAHIPSVTDTLNSVDLSQEVIFTDVEEAERIMENYRAEHKRNVMWLPRYTTGGDVVYYCHELDLYCPTMPLATFNTGIDSCADADIPPRDVIYDSSILKRDSEFTTVNEMTDTILTKADSDSSSNKDFDPLKRESNASSVNSQSTSASMYHHFSQPLFCMDDLFYYQPSDLRSWSDLREKFLYFLNLSHKALKDYDKQLFSTHFSRLNKIISFVVSATRLIQDDFVRTKYEKSIRRKLKRILSSYSQIYSNGLLHLSVMYYDRHIPESRLFSFNLSKFKTRAASTAQNSPTSSISTIRHESDDHYFGSNNSSKKLSRSDSGFISYLQQIEFEIDNLKHDMNALINILLKLSIGKKVRKSDYDGTDPSGDEGVDRYDILPQVYPRFIVDEFNGGNWCNPFFESKNTVLNASGDELKNRYHLKIIIDRDAFETVRSYTDEMIKLSEETFEYIDPKVQHIYYNLILKNERNTHILRLIYKYLYFASLMIDLIEAFDFTVFCLIHRYTSSEDDSDKVISELNNTSPGPESEITSNLTFDYPIVLEFFQLKQQFHDIVSRIVMATQSLTLEDPDVFKGIKQDDPVYYDRDILKNPNEKAAMLLTNILMEENNNVKGSSISLNCDSLMYTYLSDGLRLFGSLLPIIELLIGERESILNYATRVMHDDLNVQLLLMERNNTVLSEKSDEGHAYYTGKKQSDAPWYLEGDDEYDLLLDIKGNIKGGTKQALVAHLTHHDYFDSNFNSAFLLTFATMMPIGEFLTLLINRFNLEAPEGLSYEEYNRWISKKQSPIRLRVINVMKLLIERYWAESYYDESVLRRWLAFVQSPEIKSFSMSKVLQNHLQSLLNHEKICYEKEPSIPTSKPPPPLIKGYPMKKTKLLDIDFIELARQLTIKEFKLYSKITKFECLTKVWGNKSGLHEDILSITNFIRTSNQLTNFVAYMILRKQDVKKRVHIITYFVQVAEKCKQYNNFSSMTAIISALYSSPVHRLNRTWKHVPAEALTNLRNMNKLMNSSRNFNEYRDVLKFVGSEPCVPFFGVYLSDLTFVYHGNPDYLMNRSRMINFAKRSKTCEIVTGIDRFKCTAYNLQEVNDIQEYLLSWFDKCPTIEEQYQLSLNLEPRMNVSGNNAANRNQKYSSGTFSFGKH